MRIFQLFLTITLFSFLGCSGSSGNSKHKVLSVKEESRKDIKVPSFSADSAYHFVEKQVSFGPRVPNSEAHVACGDYLVSKLKEFKAEVIEQKMELKAFDNTRLKARNIIGSFNPDNPNRILLFSHWDSRPFADMEKVMEEKYKPILGANDGASGVGVLLEMARLIGQQQPELGIDIIFFDAEDYGWPEFSKVKYKPETWCLGSQYWAKHPHKKRYTARYGILLDMVGAPNAIFAREGHSDMYARPIVDKVWNKANDLGYGQFFQFMDGGMITDDHVYVNKMGIPSIDIIQYDPTTNHSFGSYWHTHGDDLSVINKKTLKAVGQTLLEVIYNER